MDAARRASILTVAFLALAAVARAGDGMPDPVETIKEMIGAMTAAKPVRDTIVQRAFLSQDLLRLMGASKAERWRDFNADPILGTQDWSDWRLDKVVPRGNEVNAVFTSGKTRIQRDYVVVKDGADWRIDDVIYHDGDKVSNLRNFLGAAPAAATQVAVAPITVATPPLRGGPSAARLQPSPNAAAIAMNYPWTVKAQSELTAAECAAATRHDANYWWARGKCHMKFIRYAAGVATRDTHALEDASSTRRRGELFSPTQYRPDEDAYCEHGGYCYPAKDIKLIGSIRTPPDAGMVTGDASDAYQGITTSCELLEDDRTAVVAAGAQDLLRDCR